MLTAGKNLMALSFNGLKMTSVFGPLNPNELNVFKTLKRKRSVNDLTL